MTLEQKIFKSVALCSTREEFLRKHHNLYKWSFRIGVHAKACAHMKIKPKAWGKEKETYSLAQSLETAKKFRTQAEFRKHHADIYDCLKNNFLLKEFQRLANFEAEDKCSSIGEVTTRDWLNRLLNIRLEKNNKLLKSPFSNKFLELDGFDSRVKIALEYNGATHLDPKVIKKDIFKKEECAVRGIKLIVITEPKKSNAELINLIQDQVYSELSRLGIEIKHPTAPLMLLSNALNKKKK